MNIKQWFSRLVQAFTAKKQATPPSGVSYEKIGLGKIADCSVDTIRYALDEGSRYIDNQTETGREIRAKSLAMFGVLATVFAGLVGYSFLLVEQGMLQSPMLYLSVFGAFAVGSTAYLLFVGAIYQKEYKISGNKPAHILCDTAVDFARTKPGGEFHKYILAQQLNVIMEKIEFNKQANARMQQSFKGCFQLLFLYAILAAIAFFVYWLLR